MSSWTEQKESKSYPTFPSGGCKIFSPNSEFQRKLFASPFVEDNKIAIQPQKTLYWEEYLRFIPVSETLLISKWYFGSKQTMTYVSVPNHLMLTVQPVQVSFWLFSCGNYSSAILLLCTGGTSTARHPGPSYLVTAMGAHQHCSSEWHRAGRKCSLKVIKPVNH